MPEIGIYRMEMNIMIIMLISAYSYSVDLPPAALAYEFNFSNLKRFKEAERSTGRRWCKSKEWMHHGCSILHITWVWTSKENDNNNFKFIIVCARSCWKYVVIKKQDDKAVPSLPAARTFAILPSIPAGFRGEIENIFHFPVDKTKIGFSYFVPAAFLREGKFLVLGRGQEFPFSHKSEEIKYDVHPNAGSSSKTAK